MGFDSCVESILLWGGSEETWVDYWKSGWILRSGSRKAIQFFPLPRDWLVFVYLCEGGFSFSSSDIVLVSFLGHDIMCQGEGKVRKGSITYQ